MVKQDIKSMLPSEIGAYLESIGERPFRKGQIFRWLHRGAVSFHEMTDLPQMLREKIDDDFYISPPALLQKQVSKKDSTAKYLWQFEDEKTVESVLMRYAHGDTACISSQVGCRMGCAFCASAIDGLERNLLASEMLDQVLFTQRDSGRRISNIVLMGIGEPLDNFENVMRFIQLVTDRSGMNVGARHITLSTCGIIENVDKLAQYDVQSTLAVSLHAPDDQTRSALMPINRSTGVDNLLRACSRYFSRTGRRVTYEYAMIDRVNDHPAQAGLLSQKLKKSGGHLNIILLNPVPGLKFQQSSPERVTAFTKHLKQKGVNYTVRRRLGADIESSCGQLRRRI